MERGSPLEKSLKELQNTVSEALDILKIVRNTLNMANTIQLLQHKVCSANELILEVVDSVREENHSFQQQQVRTIRVYKVVLHDGIYI